jgi:hypothetical protein
LVEIKLDHSLKNMFYIKWWDSNEFYLIKK